MPLKDGAVLGLVQTKGYAYYNLVVIRYLVCMPITTLNITFGRENVHIVSM